MVSVHIERVWWLQRKTTLYWATGKKTTVGIPEEEGKFDEPWKPPPRQTRGKFLSVLTIKKKLYMTVPAHLFPLCISCLMSFMLFIFMWFFMVNFKPFLFVFYHFFFWGGLVFLDWIGWLIHTKSWQPVSTCWSRILDILFHPLLHLHPYFATSLLQSRR